MKHLLALAALVLLPLLAHAQSVKLPAEVKVQPGRLASVTIEYDGDDLKWTTPSELDVFREYDPDAKKIRLRLIGYAQGKYHVHAVACKGGKLSDFATCVIIIGDPAPTPPTPPNPPDPPTPDPKDKGPFAGAPGLHVLIVFESGENLTKEHHAIVYGKKFRDYLAVKCAKGPDGSPQRRIYDQNDDLSGAPKLFKDAMKRSRGAVPWIAIGNGAHWHEGPLTTEAEVESLLKKIGG